MRRRSLLAQLGAATAASPIAARAQVRNEKKRVGVLMHLPADDPEAQARNAAFLQGLEVLGWRVGRNIGIDYRWSAHPDLHRKSASERVALRSDVLVTTNTAAVRALQQSTQTIPIVFSSVIDPVGSGLIASLSRPGGNSTGFALFEYGVSGKWLELLMQVVPSTKRVAVVRDATTPSGIGQFAAIQTVASSVGVELRPIDVTGVAMIEGLLESFAGSGSSGGLIVTSSPNAIIHRESIVALAAKHRLPAVYPFRLFPSSGGLLSYGPDLLDVHRRCADYVDRILKGQNSADLPVQAPTKYELVVNLTTARTLGLTIPPSLLARADEVME